MEKDKIATIVAIVAILAGSGYWAYQKYGSPDYDDGVACTQEARSCPDGSYVGRVPPSCEFAACPDGRTPLPPQEIPDTTNWQTYRNKEYGFEFGYPNEWARNDWQVSGPTVLGTDFSSPDYKARSEYLGGDFPQEILEKGAEFAIYVDSFAAYSPYTFEELKSDKSKDGRVSKTTEIEVAGERALYQVSEITYRNNAGVDVYFFSPRDNTLLFTVYLKSTTEEKDSYLYVFNQILSTFKFIK